MLHGLVAESLAPRRRCRSADEGLSVSRVTRGAAPLAEPYRELSQKTWVPFARWSLRDDAKGEF